MKRHIGLLLLAALSVVSCNKEGEIFYREGEQKTEEATVTRALQNASDPFAIDAMQQALDLVAADDPSVPRITLQPTGYYVKFNPQDSVQMATLDGLGIELFSHPLDNGIYPETEPEEVTEDTPIVYEPLYAVVPAGFVFPEEVDYELIHGVFIQNKRGPASDEGQLPAGVYASVLDASLRLTGNVSSARSTVQPFQPSARLRFEITDKSGYGINNDTLPLVGAKVLAFYYTDVSWGVTDDNGETGPICTTNTPVRYEVHWGDDRWNVYIANKNKKRISILDGTHTGPVDVVFADGTWEGVMSGMHTALYSYFYRDYPLTRYLIKGDYTLDIATMTKGGRSSAAPVRPLREIYFYGKYKGASRYHTPEKAMNTMFHELGHISHHKLEPLKFIVRALRKDGESWATGVEYAYMKSFFPEYTDPNNRGEKNKYTRVVECLLKNGFSMGDIQHGFHESGGWDSWQVEMRRIVTGRTDMTDDEKEGFCWNNVLTTYMKCKKKEKTVQSTESMSFFSCTEQTPEYYLISIMNSRFAAFYVDNLVNSTSHCTTGDAKLIPIMTPTIEQLYECKRLFDRAFELKRSVAKGIATDLDIAEELNAVERANDLIVESIYQL